MRMATADGNGWVDCACGRRHWGRHGASGLLLTRPGVGPGETEVLLQLRAAWTHEGGTWGVPGGARDSHEDDVAAALREAGEETGLDPSAVRVLGTSGGVDHGTWRYTYVLAACGRGVRTAAATGESDDVRWVGLAEVAALPLHSAFARAWPGLLERLLERPGPVVAGR